MTRSAQGLAPHEYDAQLKMSAVIPDFDECIARCRALSLEARKNIEHAEYSYGNYMFERVDVFLPTSKSNSRPVHVFFHGGDWRSFDKHDYSFIARPIVDANAVAVIANYGLMPAVTMRKVVAQCRSVIHWLHANAIRFGADRNRISISGHSAGAHLAALLSLTRWVEHSLPEFVIKSTLAVSGIYDLGPVFQSSLGAETRMLAEDVAHFSPVAWVERGRRPATPVLLAFGEEETMEFQRQSTTFAQVLQKHAVDLDCLKIPQRHHMNVVFELGSAQTDLGRKLIEAILAT